MPLKLLSRLSVPDPNLGSIQYKKQKIKYIHLRYRVQAVRTSYKTARGEMKTNAKRSQKENSVFRARERDRKLKAIHYGIIHSRYNPMRSESTYKIPVSAIQQERQRTYTMSRSDTNKNDL
jgi:hypothetical protein